MCHAKHIDILLTLHSRHAYHISIPLELEDTLFDNDVGIILGWH